MAKYIHFLLANELKFTSRVVELIANPDNGLEPEKHLFITPYPKVYEALKKYGRVVLDTKKGNLYNRYYRRCDWMFTHGLLPKPLVFTTKNAAMKKLIYRYWGGSVTTFLTEKTGSAVKDCVNKLKVALFKWFYNRLAAIGIANVTDVIDLSRLLPNQRFFRMPYAATNTYPELVAAKQQIRPAEDGKMHVLLGHRGKHEDNHIALLDALRKFENEPVELHVPLSYGNADYIEMVKKYIREGNFRNVTVIEEFLTLPEYYKLLARMDCGIFDGVTSYALGNIAIMLFLDKTIFLNGKGVIRQAFDMEKLPYKLIEDIPEMTFEEFRKPVDYTGIETSDLHVHSPEEYIKRWKIIMENFS